MGHAHGLGACPRQRIQAKKSRPKGRLLSGVGTGAPFRRSHRASLLVGSGGRSGRGSGGNRSSRGAVGVAIATVGTAITAIATTIVGVAGVVTVTLRKNMVSGLSAKPKVVLSSIDRAII